jgi:hypothetical protein
MPTLAACRNFGMSFALSLVWKKRQIVILIIPHVSRFQGMYHIHDIVNMWPANMKTRTLYVTINFRCLEAEQQGIM